MSNIIMIDQHKRPPANIKLAEKGEISIAQATGFFMFIAAIIVAAFFRISPEQLL